MKPRILILGVLALVAVPAIASAQVQVGSRVGDAPTPSGYDDGGRRDPFVSLIVAKRPTTGSTQTQTRPALGLASLSISDVVVTGVVRAGSKMTVILQGPDKQSYMARLQDRLADGTVKAIDTEGVVFVAEQTDATGAVKGHEVRKTLRPAAEVIR
ncbi:MAG TPA: hypothetical protein VLT86_20555 [Vicinamibacterales bacterium]|nr:hypothetical protein [Vicinamibacterales bacterium]